MFGNYSAGKSPSDDMAALSRSQALIWFKPDGTVLKANENFCKTLGYDSKEIVGKHHRVFCEDAIRNSPDYAQFWQALAEGRFQQGQFQIGRASCRERV